MKKIFTLFLISVFLLTSCVTPYLKKENSYEETIHSFLMTEDKQKLVVIGEQYHYIFNMDEALQKVLSSEYRVELVPSFRRVESDYQNKMKADFNVYANVKDSPELVDWLLVSGFVEGVVNKETQKRRYYSKYTIHGERYLASAEVPSAYKFKKAYKLNVVERPSPLKKKVKAAVTPVAKAVDGTLVVVGGVAGTAVVLGVLLPVAFLAIITGQCNSC